MTENTCVIGLMWGDESKGKIVDALAGEADVVVRYNGGANAGHTVVVDGEKYAFHLIPSGIIRRGVLNVAGHGMVIDPVHMLEEMEALRQRGVQVGDNLRVSDKAHVVMPYHKAQDRLSEAKLSGKEKIGTTARGIGPCYADKANRSTAFRLGDLLRGEKFAEKLARIVAEKNAAFTTLYGAEPMDADAILAEYTAAGERLAPFITDTARLLHEQLAAGKRMLFEGAHGLLLDIDVGTYPFVTSSNCGSGQIAAGAGVEARTVTRCVGVAKAYYTRVGAGPFPTEQDNPAGQKLREKGQEYGTTTGRPRRCGWFDAVATRYTARVGGATELAVTKLDVLSGVDPIRLCRAYRVDGRETTWFDADEQVVSRAEPVYEELPGWTEDISRLRRWSDLPANARRYLARIEELVGREVSMASIGPERSELIFRQGEG